MTPSGIEPEIFRFVSQHLNYCATAVPGSHVYKYIYLNTCEQGIYIYIMGRVLGRYSDRLRVGKSGIESQWGRDFPPVQTGPEAHPASCKMSTGSFPGVK